MDRVLFVLVCLAALGSAIVGGIFYGFSSFVMRALGRIPPEQGVAAMNSINVVVINPSFMIVFMGTALVCLVLAASSIFWWQAGSSKLVLAAALLYFAGSLGLTMVVNQLMNLRLAGAGAGFGLLARVPRIVDRLEPCSHGGITAGLGVVRRRARSRVARQSYPSRARLDIFPELRVGDAICVPDGDHRPSDQLVERHRNGFIRCGRAEQWLEGATQ